MKGVFKFSAASIVLLAISVFFGSEANAATKNYYVATNDDVKGPNTVTMYAASGTPSSPKLDRVKTISTGGVGLGGGYFGIVDRFWFRMATMNACSPLTAAAVT